MGGVIAVRISDGVLSLGSLVGFLAVFGIAARNEILMISHFQRLELEDQAFGPTLAKHGRGRAVGTDHDVGLCCSVPITSEA